MKDLIPLAHFFKDFPCPVVILDLETTGGDFIQDRITEIAYLYICHGKIIPVSQLINPQKVIPTFITNLTGISNQMVLHAPTFKTFISGILQHLRGSLIIAHNSQFDYSMLQNECHRHHISFATHHLCSVKLSRKLYPQEKKHSLDSLIERHQITTEHRHRAMSDVLILAKYLQLTILQQGHEYCRQMLLSLIQPTPILQALPKNLANTIQQLPNTFGVSIWRNHLHQITDIRCHKHSYNEIYQLLHRTPNLMAETKSIDFMPSIGIIHAHQLQAELLQQHQLIPNAIYTGYHHIMIEADEQGCLKARIRQLKNGIHQQPPTGIFPHPKAAKKALVAWAKENQICPSQLGIVKETANQHIPCPMAVVSNCVPACQHNNIQQHNQNVTNALNKLPNMYGIQEIEYQEIDPINQAKQLIKCNNGAIQLNNAHWYTDKTLIEILKKKLKKTS